MSEPRNEELARRLLEEPPEAWPGELQGLRIETRQMPAALRARLDSLATAEVTDAQSAGRFRGRRPTAWFAGPARLALAAGFTAAVCAIGLYVFANFRSGGGRLQAALTFVRGDVRSGARKLGTGERLGETDVLSVGKDSVAALLVAQGPLHTELRVSADTELRFTDMRAALLEARLSRGAAMVRVSRSAAAQPGEGGPLVALSSPAAIASVRGTHFSLDLNSAGDTRLSVYAGTVSFRRRWPQIEELPAALITQSPLLSGAMRILTHAASSVKEGGESVVLGRDLTDRARRLMRLRSALAEPSVAGLRGRPSVSQAELNAALASLAHSFSAPAEPASTLKLMAEEFGVPPHVTFRTSEELDDRRLALESVSPAERESRYQTLIKKLADSSMDKETFRREVTAALGKAPQEIRLKNGKTVYGSVFGVDGRYRVYTRSGVQTLAPDEIEEILFQ